MSFRRDLYIKFNCRCFEYNFKSGDVSFGSNALTVNIPASLVWLPIFSNFQAAFIGLHPADPLLEDVNQNKNLNKPISPFAEIISVQYL